MRVVLLIGRYEDSVYMSSRKETCKDLTACAAISLIDLESFDFNTN